MMSAILLLAAALTAGHAVWQMAGMDRAAESGRELGWAIHFDFTGVHREMRISVALFFSAVALWLRKGSMWFLIALTVLFSAFIFVTWFLGAQSYPNQPRLEFHILAGLAIMSALILWLRGVRNPGVAVVGALYVILEFLLWWLTTRQLKGAIGTDLLEPPTLINNLFYGAEWWHLGLPLIGIVLFIWQTAIFLLEKRKTPFVHPCTSGDLHE